MEASEFVAEGALEALESPTTFVAAFAQISRKLCQACGRMPSVAPWFMFCDGCGEEVARDLDVWEASLAEHCSSQEKRWPY